VLPVSVSFLRRSSGFSRQKVPAVNTSDLRRLKKSVLPPLQAIPLSFPMKCGQVLRSPVLIRAVGFWDTLPPCRWANSCSKTLRAIWNTTRVVPFFIWDPAWPPPVFGFSRPPKQGSLRFLWSLPSAASHLWLREYFSFASHPKASVYRSKQFLNCPTDPIGRTFRHSPIRSRRSCKISALEACSLAPPPGRQGFGQFLGQCTQL
jgi:hypothetical protein